MRFVDQARQLGIGVQVVSDGLDYAIQVILAREGMGDLPIVANRLLPAGPRRWKLETPWSRPDCASANCKCGQLAGQQAAGKRVLYVGDGSSDFCVSGKAEHVLAKAKLLDHCRANGIVHSAFVDFDEALAPAPDPVRPERGVHGMNKAATVLAPPGAGYIRGEARERAEPLEMLADEYLLEGQGERARTGILLIHGLTGTPNEMRVLARGLHLQGYTVYAVKLAGHCGTLDDLVGTSWLDWLASVRRARTCCRAASIAWWSAACRWAPCWRWPWRRSVPSTSPACWRCRRRFATTAGACRAAGLPAARHARAGHRPAQRVHGTAALRHQDEALRARVVSQMHAGDSAASGLPGNPWWSVVEMHKLARSVLRNMPALRAPCLVMHARNDDIASVSNAYEIQRRAVNAPVTLQLLDDSYHMITIDRERRVVIARGGLRDRAGRGREARAAPMWNEAMTPLVVTLWILNLLFDSVGQLIFKAAAVDPKLGEGAAGAGWRAGPGCGWA